MKEINKAYFHLAATLLKEGRQDVIKGNVDDVEGIKEFCLTELFESIADVLKISTGELKGLMLNQPLQNREVA